MFALLPGQVSPYPVTSVAGYFVLRVEGRRQRATPTFDEARPQLEHELRNEAVREAITSLLTEVKIVPATTPAALPK
jgi:peptidyl-prolyl cis-trans isomerase C